MIVVLVGYPGSQKIVKASKYLTEKYLIDGVSNWLPRFDITYLNYKGEIKGWSQYLSGFLEYLTDEYIILALDDYLISNTIDIHKFNFTLDEMGGDVACIKLCQSTPEEHEEYPVTTQYCVWNRQYLIYLLNHINTPWQFEIDGSFIFRQHGKKCLHRPCLEYFANSSISGRWGGIRLDGLNNQDCNYIIDNLLPIGTSYHKSGEYAGTSGELKPNEKYNGFI